MIRGKAGDFEALMQRAGLTIDETAELIGRSPRTVRRYMSGTGAPVPRLLIRTLAEAANQRCTRLAARGDTFSFIDLFAGIGGLRRPFEELDGKCLFTSKWDRFARETYAANFPEAADSDHLSAGDIRPFAEDPSSVPAGSVATAILPSPHTGGPAAKTCVT